MLIATVGSVRFCKLQLMKYLWNISLIIVVKVFNLNETELFIIGILIYFVLVCSALLGLESD